MENKKELGMKEELISIAEYAAIYGVTTNAIQRRALRDGFTSARKIGRNWVIDKNEPFTDRRIKSGKYIKKEENKDLQITLDLEN